MITLLQPMYTVHWMWRRVHYTYDLISMRMHDRLLLLVISMREHDRLIQLVISMRVA